MTFASPNHGPRKGPAQPELIVIHYTAMPSCAAARARLCDPAAEVSAHWLIAEDGARGGGDEDRPEIKMPRAHERARAHQHDGRWNKQPDDQQGLAEGNEENDDDGPAGMGRKIIKVRLDMFHDSELHHMNSLNKSKPAFT